MRAFIAIELSKKIKSEIGKIQEEIKKFGLVKAKFVDKDLAHLTLKFLGEIDDFQVNKIKETLKQIKLEPFKVKLNGLGVFPNENFIRVVWIDVLPKEKLTELQENIDEALSEQGFRKEKSFETHVTLARVKFVKDKKALLTKLKEIKVEPLEFEIKGFALKKSTLTGEGPVYENIFVF